jgi:hypothetical protein
MSQFSCKDTVRLVSESLDGELPLGRRLALRLHLLLCGMCTRFRRNLLFLRAAARRLEEQADSWDSEQGRLSAGARERMKHALEEGNS